MPSLLKLCLAQTCMCWLNLVLEEGKIYLCPSGVYYIETREKLQPKAVTALLELEDMKNNSLNQHEIKKRKVIGIDIDIRKHNRELIEKHFLSYKIEMIQSSSVKQDTFNNVKSLSKDYRNILVILDSNHTESHVLKELNLYSSLISKNSYCIVFDTIVEKMDSEFSKNRPWNKKNSPQSAIQKFLKKNDEFIVDKTIDKKIILSMAPGGFLKKIK